MSNYSIVRIGTNMFLTSGARGFVISAHDGKIEDLPSHVAEELRKLGANPSNYFFFNNHTIRRTHQERVMQIVAEARDAYQQSLSQLRIFRQSIEAAIVSAENTAMRMRSQTLAGDPFCGVISTGHLMKAESHRSALREFDKSHPELAAGHDPL